MGENISPALIEGGAYVLQVAHAGFEPAVFALRGRCPRPLDECARSVGSYSTKNWADCQIPYQAG